MLLQQVCGICISIANFSYVLSLVCSCSPVDAVDMCVVFASNGQQQQRCANNSPMRI